MRDDEAAFVDAMGQLMGSYGMTPMAGRLWAWLLICEPPEQTAAELAEALQASRGAVSGSVAFLAASGMIRRMRRRGDRREFLSAPPGTFNAILRTVGGAYGRVAEITADGLAAIADRPAPSRARLAEVHEAAVFIQTEFPAAIERYLRQRAAGAAAAADAGADAASADRSVAPAAAAV